MELIAAITNTILLIVIFLYQINKNKLLSERIAEQSNLLVETKNVVTQQAEAINSQKKVVDTALEYTKIFDVSKIESMIRREVELDYKEVLKKKEEDSNKKISDIQLTKDTVIERTKYEVKYVTEEMAHRYIGPLTGELYRLLISYSKEDREKVLSKIPDAIAGPIRKGLDESYRMGPSGRLE